MRIFSINRGIGWASSGVEYAQSYRNRIFEKLGFVGKFIFTDMFRTENIEHFTANMGFSDENVIWLYGAFSDIPVSPCTVPLEKAEKLLANPIKNRIRLKGGIQLTFAEQNTYANMYYSSQDSRYVQRVEYVVRGFLIRTDYYTCTKIFSEFWAPKDGKAVLYMRRFYNMDGSCAYEEFVGAGLGTDRDGAKSLFRFPDALIDGKERLIGRLVRKLNLQKGDVLLIDRATEIGRGVLDEHGDSQLVTVIHAEHFSDKAGDAEVIGENILWNNFYEYTFSQAGKGMWYIASTRAQQSILSEQMRQQKGVSPRIYAIPVGSLAHLTFSSSDRAIRQNLMNLQQGRADESDHFLLLPETRRRPHSLITASRLAGEKHVDWIVRAVVQAHRSIPDLCLDIYGKGGEEQKIRNLIAELGAGGYIRLMGHQNLEKVYVGYDAYISASTSEGFGLTLMEAVGSGLGMIGFDVRYGNLTFIENGKNGVLLPFHKEEDLMTSVNDLAGGICRLFDELEGDGMRQRSYQIAEGYLENVVLSQWKRLLEDAGGAI